MSQMNAVLKPALYAGLIAGSVDIGAAALINMANPLRILLAIASGLLGREAGHGGAWVMILGLLLQWLMSILIAAIFAWAAVKVMPTLARRWVLWGAIYGVVIFLVMNFVVVPLSAAPFKPHLTAAWVGENLLAMLVFGWLVAAVVGKALRPQPAG